MTIKQGPFLILLVSAATLCDVLSAAQVLPARVIDRPDGPTNLAYTGNGAKAAVSSAAYHDKCNAANLNDGKYEMAWIPTVPQASFQIELARPTTIGRFRYFRAGPDRLVKRLTIEVSLDGRQWKQVFQHNDLTTVPGFDPRWVTEIRIAPVEARFVRGTVEQAGIALAEFEVYAPAAAPARTLPAVLPLDLTGRREILLEKRYLNLPIKNHAPHRRMTVSVDGRDVRVLDIELAPGEPDFWAFLDMAAYRGRKAMIVVDCVPEDSSGLKSISQDDQIRGSENLYKEMLRPQFHYTPKRGWVNDPNGLVFYDGEWHLFYQHHPVGWVWGGFTHWGHAVSRDLLHWEELPEALYPIVMAKGMCWSGSAVVNWENTSGLQTGKEKVLVAFFFDTACGEALAYSNDRGRTWTYWKDNPVVKHRGRDPKVFWYAPGKHWVMIVYDETDGIRNFAIYNSANLKQWTLQSHLPGYFECPELFELPVDGDKNHTRWVVFGVDSQYALGRFDGKQFTPDHPGKHVVHSGYYAASQTFTDAPDGRRIQIGWGKIDMPGMPFNQMMTVPCELTLRTTADGVRMFAEPVRELEKLRGKGEVRENLVIQPGKLLEMPVEGALLDVRAEFELGKATGFGMSVLGRWLGYDAVGKTLNGVPLAPVDGKIRLRLLVDRSSLEICGNDGRVNLTTPFTANEKDRALRFRSDGAATKVERLEMYELKSIWE